MPFWLPFCSQIRPNQRFCPPNGTPKRPQIDPRGSQESLFFVFVFVFVFDTILDPFWLPKPSPLGTLFGAKIDKKTVKISSPKKMVPRAPQDAPKRLPRRPWEAPGPPKTPPRGPQDPPRGPQEHPKRPPRASKTPQNDFPKHVVYHFCFPFAHDCKRNERKRKKTAQDNLEPTAADLLNFQNSGC